MRSDYEIVFYPVARTENEGALCPGYCVCILISCTSCVAYQFTRSFAVTVET